MQEVSLAQLVALAIVVWSGLAVFMAVYGLKPVK